MGSTRVACSASAPRREGEAEGRQGEASTPEAEGQRLPDVGVFQIPIVRCPLPRRGGFSILYRCPGCGQPRRYLYLRSLVIGRLVDYQGPLCQACAGLRWASQGRYIGVFHRGFPLPRHPRDPRAVSDPRLILDEFPDLVADRELVPGPD